MFKAPIAGFVVAMLFAANAVFAQDADLSRIRDEMKQLQRGYEERMQALERRLSEAEARTGKAAKGATGARSRARQAQQTAAQAGKRATEAQQSAAGAGTRADSAQQSAAQATTRAGEAQQAATQAEQRAGTAEQRAIEADKRAGTAEASAAQAGDTAAAATRRTGENAFNPAISLILQGTWARTSQDPNNFAITGFVPSGGEVGPARRSFNLGESELVVTANIDPYFRGTLITALAPDNALEVEEAFFQTLALPRGLTLKAGRFLSGAGYQNELHPHFWDFADAPLPYKAFLGGRLRQDGVQLRWIAPTSLFFEVGGEIARGEAFPGAERNRNAASAAVAFAHVGGDVGESYAWRAGLSYLRTSPRNRSYEDLDALGGTVSNSFSGRARVWIVDGVLKWSPNGDSSYTNVKLQGEYFHSRQDGTLAYDDTGGSAVFGSLADTFRTSQSGWYAQGVWQFMPRWRVGYRYDALRRGTVENGIVASGLGPTAADFRVLAAHDPSRNTAMVDFSLTDFSRFRLQAASDKSRLGATDRQLILQYIHSLGPHGAHRF